MTHYDRDGITVHHGDELELAYLAGVMDSDGWLTIQRHDRAAPTGGRWVTYSEMAGCGQVGPQAVELLCARFGGTIRLRKRAGTKWQPMHYWRCQGQRAADLAAQLAPYLRIKRAHAGLLLDLRASKDLPFNETRCASGLPRGRMVSPEVVAERHQLWVSIRAMNDRRERPKDGI